MADDSSLSKSLPSFTALQWCQPCCKLPLTRIFNPLQRRRQQRHVISHPYTAGCPMCTFIKELEELDSSGNSSLGDNTAIESGTPTFVLSNFDTYEHWWHVLALTTERPKPHYAWFQHKGAPDASRSDRALALVTCTDSNTGDGVPNASIPRLRSHAEQS